VKGCTADRVRNFVLAGHAGAGKTSLADLMLFKTGMVARLGNVNEGTSVSDYREEEKERRSSIYTSAMHLGWKDHHFFFTDTPGYADFRGEASSAIQVADIVMIVVDAVNGIENGSIRAWKQAQENGIPRAFFINGLDKEHADYQGVLARLQKNYGATTVIPLTLPIGEREQFERVVRVLGQEDVPADLQETYNHYREMLMDTVAESDEELMERYLGGEALSEADISKGLHAAVLEGAIVPVFAGSAVKDIGISRMMDGIINLFPNPLTGHEITLSDSSKLVRSIDGTGEAMVFKSVSDPFVGQLTYMRVYAGKFCADSEVNNVTRGEKERFGSLLRPCGKEQQSGVEAGPGEIIAVAKLKYTHICDTLSTNPDAATLPPLKFLAPVMSFAIYPDKKGDDEKIAAGLTKLTDEDPTLSMKRDPETHETLLSGMGDQHLNNVVQRLEKSYKVKVRLETPKVPYRETIKGVGSATYRHKKQSGGHGQFAEVQLRVEPLQEEEFLFASEVVGGSIPKNFIPAVEKGVVETLPTGPLAHCKLINLKAIVFDGKYHPVDSSEMAFKIAARSALRAAVRDAKPQLLEPVMTLKIMFPDEYMGDISGDISSRRGRILGMGREEGMQILQAEVPMAETFTYATQLRSLTQGRGSFEMAFERYEPVPANLAQQIQESVAKDHEEE
jgi:elongation factor G